MTSTGYTVDQVAPEQTRPLRRALLKQNSTLDDLAESDGDYPTAGYYAAIGQQGLILAVASARPEVPTWPCNAVAPWRVRAVATISGLHGQGIGSAVMHAVLDHIESHGGDFVWLNGRTPARTFYEKLGFTEYGDEWIDPESGPHMTMMRRLP